jgi:hypothetical protein
MIAPVITTKGMNTNQNLFITASVTGIDLVRAVSRRENALPMTAVIGRRKMAR